MTDKIDTNDPATPNTEIAKQSVFPTAEQIAAKREAAMAGIAKSGDAKAGIVPISAAKMDDLGELVSLGSLRLCLHALSIRRTAAIQAIIEGRLPTVLVYAALADQNALGIDLAATAAFWSAVNENAGQEAIISESEVAQELRRVTQRIGHEMDTFAENGECIDGEPASGNETRVLDDVAAVLWSVAERTPGMTMESLTEGLADLTVPQLVDALRVFYLAVGGFPGDMADRFA